MKDLRVIVTKGMSLKVSPGMTSPVAMVSISVYSHWEVKSYSLPSKVLKWPVPWTEQVLAHLLAVHIHLPEAHSLLKLISSIKYGRENVVVKQTCAMSIS